MEGGPWIVTAASLSGGWVGAAGGPPSMGHKRRSRTCPQKNTAGAAGGPPSMWHQQLCCPVPSEEAEGGPYIVTATVQSGGWVGAAGGPPSMGHKRLCRTCPQKKNGVTNGIRTRDLRNHNPAL